MACPSISDQSIYSQRPLRQKMWYVKYVYNRKVWLKFQYPSHGEVVFQNMLYVQLTNEHELSEIIEIKVPSLFETNKDMSFKNNYCCVSEQHPELVLVNDKVICVVWEGFTPFHWLRLVQDVLMLKFYAFFSTSRWKRSMKKCPICFSTFYHYRIGRIAILSVIFVK